MAVVEVRHVGTGVSRPGRPRTRHASARSRSSRALASGRRAADLAAEHLGQLDDPALAVEALDLGDRPAVAFALGDPEVGVGVGGDLGQVRDAQDLVARASAQRLRPTGSALRPPMPVSTSSKTSVGVSSASARTCLIASATRDSSPPDAIRASGRAGSPGFGASRKTTWSTPDGIERDRVAVELDRRLVGGRRAPPERDLEHAGREPELRERLADGRRRGAAAGRPACARTGRGRRGRDLGQQPRRRRRSRRARSSSRPRRRSTSAAARSPWAMTAASSSP